MSDAQRLSRVLFQRLRQQIDPRIKDAVARRLTQRVALAVLGNRLAAWEPIHEGTLKLVSAAERAPLDTLHRWFEEACGILLRGHIVPLQQVHRAIDEAEECHLGMCVCRAAKRVEDLHHQGTDQVYLLGGEDGALPWLDRLMEAFEKHEDGQTSAGFAEILGELSRLRWAGDQQYGAATFFERTWPYSEILLKHPDYVQVWRETMQKNRRTWQVHPQVLHAWADLCYYTRGVVFTAMTLVEARYTICSCPAPENGYGCVLFNWHYYSGNPHVLEFNDQLDHRQRCDAAGQPLPCARFPERGPHPCFGCGCDHSQPCHDGLPGLLDPRPPYRR